MRKVNLDLCRVLSCFTVVMLHAAQLFWDFNPASPVWAVWNLLSLAFRCCVPLFFMISGALLLEREAMELGRHLRRIGRFVLLFYLWSAICYGLDTLFFHVWTTEGDLVPLVLAGYFHEWFLPALVLCYCALPLLHGFLHRNTALARQGVLLLCVPVVLLSTLEPLPQKPPLLAALLFPWHLSDLRYLVYFLLGWLLETRPLSRRGLRRLALAALASLLIFGWMNRRFALAAGHAVDATYGYLALPAALCAACVFSLCRCARRLSAHAAGLLHELSGYTLGVYLMHPVFMEMLRGSHFNFAAHSALWLYPACTLGFLLPSLALTGLLKKLPLLRRLVS